VARRFNRRAFDAGQEKEPMTLKTTRVQVPAGTPEETVAPTPAVAEPPLPTFPLEVGWKERYNPDTGRWEQIPLTLLDILYPPEDEVLVMPQSPYHELWTRWLATMLEGFLRGWLILHDAFIHWGRRGVLPRAPDIAAIPGGRRPEPPEKAYHVHRDGPLPAFVVEITSETTRPVDLAEKPIFYAAMGVRELLVVDFWPPEGPWRLYGYRLEDSPYYREMEPDEEGGLTFQTVGLRFVAVDRERIDVYDAGTGERLLTPEELRAAHAEAEQRAQAEAAARAEAEARAQAAEARAQAEAAARAEAEARAAELEARLRELQARYPIPSPPDTEESAEEEAEDATG